MGEYPDFRKSNRDDGDDVDDALRAYGADPLLATQSLQEIAHDRGRICKKRGCVVCAPLRERRREKKTQRQAEAQARLHSKNTPCGRSSCTLEVCVTARTQAPAAASPPSTPPAIDRRALREDADLVRRRQDEKHRVGLACGSHDCEIDTCVIGFANERTRRHRANRPCRSSDCTNPICTSARSAT